MRVAGMVRNVVTQGPVEGARVILRIGQTEVATNSNQEGRYSWGDDASYGGQLLTCRVEKVGFQPKEVSHGLEGDAVYLDMELTPVVADTVLRVSVEDESGRPVEQVAVTLEHDAVEVARSVSDERGLVAFTLRRELEGTILAVKAERAGWHDARREVEFGSVPSLAITLTRSSESAFWQRVLNAVRLGRGAFEEVAADRKAFRQAIVAVLLSGVAAGVGGIGMLRLVIGTILAVGGWCLWALLIYLIGARKKADVGAFLRVVGFSSAPGMIRVLGVLGTPYSRGVFLVATVWMAAAMVVGVNSALPNENRWRNLGVCAIAWIFGKIVLGVVFTWLGLQGRIALLY